jgi:hypothetical protein
MLADQLLNGLVNRHSCLGVQGYGLMEAIFCLHVVKKLYFRMISKCLWFIACCLEGWFLLLLHACSSASRKIQQWEELRSSRRVATRHAMHPLAITSSPAASRSERHVEHPWPDLANDTRLMLLLLLHVFVDMVSSRSVASVLVLCVICCD